MSDIRWRIAVPENIDRQSCIDFLGTNQKNQDTAKFVVHSETNKICKVLSGKKNN